MGRDRGGARQEGAEGRLAPRALQEDRRRERDQIGDGGAEAQDHRRDAARRLSDEARCERGDERQAQGESTAGRRDHAVPSDALGLPSFADQNERRVGAEADEVQEGEHHDDRDRGRKIDEVQEADHHGGDPEGKSTETHAEHERWHPGEVVDETKLQVRKREEEHRRKQAERLRQLGPEKRRDLALRDDESERAEKDGCVDARPRALAERGTQGADEDHQKQRVRDQPD